MTQAPSRAGAISSFTIVKGSLIPETYTAFEHWDLAQTNSDNLRRLKEANTVGARSANWLRDVAFVISRRFDPQGRDRVLVELAQGGCDLAIWKPVLLWHMTRDEFLVRDFLVNWLYGQYIAGTFRLYTEDVLAYLVSARRRAQAKTQAVGEWTEATAARVATALLRLATDFGLLTGIRTREFCPYHLPDPSFLYLLHAITELAPNARNLLDCPDWRIFRLDAPAVELELLRLHQFRQLHYEVAGTLVQLRLPYRTAADYARTLIP